MSSGGRREQLTSRMRPSSLIFIKLEKPLIDTQSTSSFYHFTILFNSNYFEEATPDFRDQKNPGANFNL
jgi:hypothetical protein